MIVVTGGTGRVGSRLVRLLVERGERVRVFCRDGDKARRAFGDRVEVAVGDLGAPDSVRAALVGANRVFLLTAAAAEPSMQFQYERTVIGAAKQAGVRHIVKLSVLGADERSPMHYARGHREAEKELAASGLAVTILRPSGFMQGLFERVSDGCIYTCAEDGQVGFVDAGDIAAVAAAALTEEGHEGKIYQLTGPAALSHDEAATILSAATGRSIRHVRVPPAAVLEGLSRAGLPQWLGADLVAQFRAFAAGQDAQTSGDVAAVTGRAPRSLLEVARAELRDHHGEVALVTGANKGIGREIVRRLAAEAMTVYLGSRDPERGKAAERELAGEGADVRFLQLDVTDQAQIDAAVARIGKESGRLDVLVNNAGIVVEWGIAVADVTVAQMRQAYEVNVFGPVAVTRACIPLLRRSPAARVVNLSSPLGSLSLLSDQDNPISTRGLLAYSSSKTALNSITVLYANALREAGIRVNAASPGLVATDLNASSPFNRGTRTVQEGADLPVELALQAAEGPTATFRGANHIIPW